MSYKKPMIAITMGDPAGSGPEIVLKALRNSSLFSRASFVVFGDYNVFRKAAETVNATDLKLIKICDVSEYVDSPSSVNIFDLNNVDVSKIVYGKPSVLGGKASYEAIVEAVKHALSNKVHAIVTAPISKESLNMAGYNYPGHTELLADLTGSKDVKMMLVASFFKVAHVTTHVSLKNAIELIKKENVLKTIRLTYKSLIELFGLNDPKIGVSGLNPHAGESGLFGDEEIKEIVPAIQEAASEGIKVTGPYPPDTIFYRAYYNRQFDSTIAMYHDQGHIAVKMVGFMEGVNLSLGLPIIRVSPDHGTVWGKAGKGTASEGATLEAIKLAIELASKKFGFSLQ
ncbi:MAG: 4-hydroxythreonine-4-phosphate dehydrogenase PdxA [Nitrososphaeria archaeon]|nr:4-hydroxythreonine-4-phosphate dehydrogenase PdxA [Nitrososphaeria archaeon]